MKLYCKREDDDSFRILEVDGYLMDRHIPSRYLYGADYIFQKIPMVDNFFEVKYIIKLLKSRGFNNRELINEDAFLDHLREILSNEHYNEMLLAFNKVKPRKERIRNLNL